MKPFRFRAVMAILCAGLLLLGSLAQPASAGVGPAAPDLDRVGPLVPDDPGF